MVTDAKTTRTGPRTGSTRPAKNARVSSVKRSRIAPVGVEATISPDPTETVARSHALLQVMEAQLGTEVFLAGATATLADLANYAYVACAPEGNVSLEPYPQLRAWLERVEALPGFVPMLRTPVGLAASSAASLA